jgi:hypothetical protein
MYDYFCSKKKLHIFGYLHSLGIVGKPWWLGSNESDFENFRHKLWEILNFELFLSLKIQLNYKKWFWKENLVR